MSYAEITTLEDGGGGGSTSDEEEEEEEEQEEEDITYSIPDTHTSTLEAGHDVDPSLTEGPPDDADDNHFEEAVDEAGLDTYDSASPNTEEGGHYVDNHFEEAVDETEGVDTYDSASPNTAEGGHYEEQRHHSVRDGQESLRDVAEGDVGSTASPGTPGQRTRDAATDNLAWNLGEGFVRTNWEIGRGIADVARGQDSVPGATADVGREMVGMVSNDPEAWREDMRDRMGERGFDWRDDRQRVEEQLDEGGFWGTGGATYDLMEVGTQAILDNPETSIQSGGRTTLRTLTDTDSDEELADTLESGWDSYDSALGRFDALSPGDTTSKLGSLTQEFIVDPTVRGLATGLTGINPEEGEVDARADPLDFWVAPLDVVGAGGVSARLGRWGARRLAPASRAGDAGDAAITASATTRTVDAAEDAGGGADTLASGLVAGGISTAMSRGLGGITRALRGSDDAGRQLPDTVSGLRPASAPQGTSVSTDIGTVQRSIGSQPGAPRMGEDLRNVDEAFAATARGGDDVVDLSRGQDGVFRATSPSLSDAAGATTRTVSDGVDQATSGVRGLFGSTSRTVDDAASTTRGNVDNLFGGTARTGESATDARRVGSDQRIIDDVMTGTTRRPDPNAIPDTVAGFARGTEDMVGAAARGGSDAAGSATRTAESLTDRAVDGARNWWGNRSRWFQAGAGIVGLSAAADAFGLDPFGALADVTPGDDDPPVGPGEADAASVGDIIPTNHGLLHYQGEPHGAWYELGEVISENGEAETVGYATQVGEMLALELGYAANDWVYLTRGGDPTLVNSVNTIDDFPVPQPRFDSRGAAEDAWQTFIADIDQHIDDERYDEEGTGPGGEPEPHSELTGDLSVPAEVEQGQPFEAPFTVQLTVENAEYDGETAPTALVIDAGSDLVPIAESTITIPEGGGADEGVFEAPSGWGGVPEGDYDVYAGVLEGQQFQQYASDSVTVTGTGTGGGDEAQWGEAQPVEDLPGGWVLFVQERVDGSETRFMIAALDEQGQEIFIQPGGSVDHEPAFFPTAEDAIAAYEEWAQSAENGNAQMPDQTQGRPSSGGVTQRADESSRTARAPSGLVDGAIHLARQNPMLAAAVSMVALYGMYWLYQEGWFGDAYKKVKHGLGRLDPR